jgi:AdoMet-dependent heme synthase
VTSYYPSMVLREFPSLQGPGLEQYKRLYDHVAEVWKKREAMRFGAVVEPMLQWVKVKTIETSSQYIPCTAGNLTGVVYTNANISVCESHPPLGNLRRNGFFKIWDSPEDSALRAQIKAKQCYCTNEASCGQASCISPCSLPRR